MNLKQNQSRIAINTCFVHFTSDTLNCSLIVNFGREDIGMDDCCGNCRLSSTMFYAGVKKDRNKRLYCRLNHNATNPTYPRRNLASNCWEPEEYIEE